MSFLNVASSFRGDLVSLGILFTLYWLLRNRSKSLHAWNSHVGIRKANQESKKDSCPGIRVLSLVRGVCLGTSAISV